MGLRSYFFTDYQACPASATTKLKGQGGQGNLGNELCNLIIIPTSTTAGQVSIQDGVNTAIVVYQGGTSNLAPMEINFGAMRSQNGAWSVITGAGVTVIAQGRFL